MPEYMTPPYRQWVTVNGTDQTGHRITEVAYPFYDSLRDVRLVLDSWWRREAMRETVREMYLHQREIHNDNYARGFDGRFAYSDLAHGQWGRFFLDLNLRYEYLSPTRAASPGFIVYHAPHLPAAWFIGTFAARTITPTALQEIGMVAVMRDIPAFLTLGEVTARAIIGVIPEATRSAADFVRFMPNGTWPTVRVNGQQPFHIVMGYQFTTCPACMRKVLALPSAMYPTMGFLTTVAHGACPAYITPRENASVNLAMTNAMFVTEAIRRQESYLFGSMPPR